MDLKLWYYSIHHLIFNLPISSNFCLQLMYLFEGVQSMDWGFNWFGYSNCFGVFALFCHRLHRKRSLIGNSSSQRTATIPVCTNSSGSLSKHSNFFKVIKRYIFVFAHASTCRCRCFHFQFHGPMHAYGTI